MCCNGFLHTLAFMHGRSSTCLFLSWLLLLWLNTMSSINHFHQSSVSQRMHFEKKRLCSHPLNFLPVALLAAVKAFNIKAYIAEISELERCFVPSPIYKGLYEFLSKKGSNSWAVEKGMGKIEWYPMPSEESPLFQFWQPEREKKLE